MSHDWINPENLQPCDCGAVSLQSECHISLEGDVEPCPYGVVSIDDVPVGTGRIDEHGNIVDVEWDAVALAKLGLAQ